MEPKFQVQLKIRKPAAEVFDAVARPEVVREVVDNERIAFGWPANKGAPNTRVEMTFKPLDDGSTMVQISEAGWRADEAGVKASYGNAGGWMHMMCCLKAYLEYGLNLRAGGAF